VRSYATDIGLFFKGYNGHICSTEELEATVRKTINDPVKVSKSINHLGDFINYVIEHHLSEEDDSGNLMPLVRNPLSKIKRQQSHTETVRNPLPYRYIQDLRQILCPLPDKAELTVIEQTYHKASRYCLAITPTFQALDMGTRAGRAKEIRWRLV
jgi:hypothetical protein